MCPPRAETQAARRLRQCFMALSISCWSILSDSFLCFFVTAQRIFNQFCQNHITFSWHIHLRIFAESFIKFAPKLWQIYGKTNVSLFSEHRVHYCRPMSQFAPPTSWSVITLAAGRVYSTKNKASVWCLSVCLSKTYQMTCQRVVRAILVHPAH